MYEPSRKAEHLFWLYSVGTHSVGIDGTVLHVYHRPSAWSERRQSIWGTTVNPVYIFGGPFDSFQQ